MVQSIWLIAGAIWSMQSSNAFIAPPAVSFTTTRATSLQASTGHNLNASRRAVLLGAGMFGGIFGSGSGDPAEAAARKGNSQSKGPTNEIVKVVNGMKQRRLGGSDILVSELGLGTQRWVSADFNAPNRDDCFDFMDEGILKGGVNLIDTAEQYPIPSDFRSPEGATEQVIGDWLKSRKVNRDKVVIATKITGGRNVTPKNIKRDCEGSLLRLGTDYIDVYQLHWPARYSPQSNWGQSLKYNLENDMYSPYWRGNGGPTTFEELCLAMEELIQDGKIRGWGLCNDNAYGLTGCTRTAKMLGTTPPCSMQGDFSILDRKSEENGVAEAASPFNENVGFMSYNALCGGVLTGKYLKIPASVDDTNRDRANEMRQKPRGRMDDPSWGRTLYRYRTEAAIEAIREYDKISKRAGISLTELSLRWCRQRSLITTTLVGHSNLEQLKESMKIFTKKDALSDDILWEIDRVHMRNRLPLFSSTRVGKDWNNEGEIGEPIP